MPRSEFPHPNRTSSFAAEDRFDCRANLIDLLAVRTGRKLIACRERTNEVEQTVRRFARRLSFIGPAGGGSARRCANRLGYRLLNRSRDGGRPIAIEAAVVAGPKSARRRP